MRENTRYLNIMYLCSNKVRTLNTTSLSLPKEIPGMREKPAGDIYRSILCTFPYLIRAALSLMR
jgi:hypothetical protein